MGNRRRMAAGNMAVGNRHKLEHHNRHNDNSHHHRHQIRLPFLPSSILDPTHRMGYIQGFYRMGPSIRNHHHFPTRTRLHC